MPDLDRPDILIFFSDQHNALVNGYAGDRVVRTPTLDALAERGTAFDAAYTACPLCVPARVAFMSGHSTRATRVYRNDGAIRGDQATWAHALAAAGYETVLVGRMHFIGPDQRCGFTRRLVGDCCDPFWGGSREADEFRERLGDYGPTRGMGGCLNFVGGGGVSPVLQYDALVIQAALDHLAQPHDQPQCVVVGTYAPHFPYVAPRELYLDYKERVDLPRTFHAEVNYDNPTISKRAWPVDEEVARGARAAYYAMVEHMDRQIGQVREAWEAWLARSGRKGVFAYVSDHGDTIGERQIYGKQTLFEGSVRIPLIVEGAGIAAGGRVAMPVGITDLCPTLCELAGAAVLPGQAGRSLVPELAGRAPEPNRHVISDWFDRLEGGRPLPSRMVRRGMWKLIAYADDAVEDLLFDLASDPHELSNVALKHPDVAQELRALAERDWRAEDLDRELADRAAHVAILREWARVVRPATDDLCVDSARGLVRPEVS